MSDPFDAFEYPPVDGVTVRSYVVGGRKDVDTLLPIVMLRLDHDPDSGVLYRMTPVQARYLGRLLIDYADKAQRP